MSSWWVVPLSLGTQLKNSSPKSLMVRHSLYLYFFLHFVYFKVGKSSSFEIFQKQSCCINMCLPRFCLKIQFQMNSILYCIMNFC